MTCRSARAVESSPDSLLLLSLVSSSHQILENSTSLKVCNRVGAVLRRLILGLLVNGGMTPRDILLLSHGLISQSLPLLTMRDRYTHTHTHTHKLRSNCCQ